MKVYALVGKSGTGKSYQAMNVCREKGIDGIIDDGLFIYKNEILAGKSAKRENTKIGAVKTALFNEDDHRDEVSGNIKKTDPNSILVIGTSDGMVNKIIKRLDMPPADERIYIEDITTEAERRVANKQRMQQGKHVVPAPSFQLKKQFSGYFMDPMRMIRGWGFARDNFSEKSVVRPTYSYLGDFIISDRVIQDIVVHTASRIEGVNRVIRMLAQNTADGLSVTILMFFDMDKNAITTGREVQTKCAKMLEEMTAFNIEQIDIEIRGLK